MWAVKLNPSSNNYDRMMSFKGITSISFVKMYSVITCAFVLVNLLTTSKCSADAVMELTPSHFDSVVGGSQHVLVKFYAPWCGHCKTLAPVFDKLGDAYEHVNSQVIIAKVNADDHKALAQKFDVKGFPTLKFFPKGSTTPEEYEGGRDLESLAKFIEDKTQLRAKITKPVSHVVTITKHNFDDIVMDPTKHVLLEFYAPWCGYCNQIAPIYEKLGTAFVNENNCIVAKIDATVETELATRYKVEAYPTIKFFPAGKTKTPEDYTKGRTEVDFVDFLNEKCGTHRLVGGSLSEKAGRIPAFFSHVELFFKVDDKKQVIEDAKSLSKEAAYISSKYAKYYVKIMERIIEKGDKYALSELKRLTRVSKSASILPAKKDDFHIRINILREFTLLSANVDGLEDAEDVDDDIDRSEL